jgi:uncharacterized Ntn-hydrolase superfamily protein
MTFSLLVRDPGTGLLAGAAATGALCVGGWVLRGRPGAGMSASQGAAPSTFWGEGVLDRMEAGSPAPEALAAEVGPDPRRDWRQLTCLDAAGRTAAHSGAKNGAERGHLCRANRVAAGNILRRLDALGVLIETFERGEGTVGARLIAALGAAQAAGGDRRGLMSAALLVFEPDRPPMSLRVDWSPDPLAALADLHARATSGDYAEWLEAVPVEGDRFRADAALLGGGAE